MSMADGFMAKHTVEVGGSRWCHRQQFCSKGRAIANVLAHYKRQDLRPWELLAWYQKGLCASEDVGCMTTKHGWGTASLTWQEGACSWWFTQQMMAQPSKHCFL